MQKSDQKKKKLVATQPREGIIPTLRDLDHLNMIERNTLIPQVFAIGAVPEKTVNLLTK
jgi:hypothetical protein